LTDAPTAIPTALRTTTITPRMIHMRRLGLQEVAAAVGTAGGGTGAAAAASMTHILPGWREPSSLATGRDRGDVIMIWLNLKYSAPVAASPP